MKKISLILMACLVVASCGVTKKQQAQNTPVQEGESLGAHIQKSPEQLFAEDPDADNLRAWAFYNGFETSNLESFAAAAARARLADEIATLVSNAVSIYENATRVDSKPADEQAQHALLTESQSENLIKAHSKELLKGSRVVMSDKYRQSDGTVTCYAAVEISLKGVLNNLKAQTELQEAISADRRSAIKFDSQQFEEAERQAFEELKEAKMQ